MSKLAEEFFKIQTYEEFDRRREEFKRLSVKEPGVLDHMDKIFPPTPDNVIKDGIIDEVIPPDRN